MKKKVLLAVLALGAAAVSGCGAEKKSDTSIAELKVNNMNQAPVVDELKSFTWRMESEISGQYQSAYRIVLAQSEAELNNSEYIWDSGKVEDSDSTFISYTGDVLDNLEDYYWKVYVWDKDEKEIESQPARFYVGPSEDDWTEAKWIGAKSLEAEGSVSYQDTESFSWKYGRGLTCDYDFLFEGEARGGFVWTYGLGGEYKEHVMCFVYEQDGRPVLVVKKMDGYEVLSEEIFDIEEENWSFEALHHMNVQVTENDLSVYVDGNLVAESGELFEGDICTVGLWTSRCEDFMYVDNLTVLDENGRVVAEDDFEDGEAEFLEPYYAYIDDGRLRLKSGYTLASGWEEPSPLLRKEFETSGEVSSAMLYMSSLGVYEASINGEEVTTGWLNPGCSVYSFEAYYRGFDVTSFIQEGGNTIGVSLGHGRYDRMGQDWGDELAAKAILHIVYSDGSCEDIVTDGGWEACNNGPVRNDDIYAGEYYDARFEQPAYSEGGFAGTDWTDAVVYESAEDIVITASETDVVDVIETIESISITESEDGSYIVDVGKNINGVIALTANVNAGDVITIRYAENINSEDMSESIRDGQEGDIWQRNLLTADNTDYYVAAESGTISYTPSFVTRGFRYVQIYGLSSAPVEVKGLFLSTDMERCGYFECSDEAMNALYQGILLTQQDNYVDIPTDCPQRDERLGWSGDAQVFATTGSYNYDTYNFLKQYLYMINVQQLDNGIYPETVPSGNPVGGANGWSDAGILLTWKLYLQYGDKQLIVDNLDAMCRYMDYLVESSEDNIRYHQGYSDLWAISSVPDEFANTAQVAYCAKVLGSMCRIVGDDIAGSKYEQLYEDVRAAFIGNFVNEDGTTQNWMQAEYALILAFGLYQEECMRILEII